MCLTYRYTNHLTKTICEIIIAQASMTFGNGSSLTREYRFIPGVLVCNALFNSGVKILDKYCNESVRS